VPVMPSDIVVVEGGWLDFAIAAPGTTNPAVRIEAVQRGGLSFPRPFNFGLSGRIRGNRMTLGP